MGFLSDLGINDEDVQESGFTDPDPGYYNYEITESTVVNGTSSDPDDTKFRVTYALFGDDDQPAGTKSEWWTLAQDGDVDTERARQSQGYLKGRLKDLGYEGTLNDLDEGDLDGFTGTLRLIQKGEYTNIRNVKGNPRETKAAAPARTTRAAGATTAKANPFKKS